MKVNQISQTSFTLKDGIDIDSEEFNEVSKQIFNFMSSNGFEKYLDKVEIEYENN